MASPLDTRTRSGSNSGVALDEATREHGGAATGALPASPTADACAQPPATTAPSVERLTLAFPAPGKLAAYAVVAAAAVFAGAQVLALLVAAGPAVLVAVLAFLGLWLAGRVKSGALGPDPRVLLHKARFEQAHSHARRDGNLGVVRDHLAYDLPVPAADLRAPLGELYERLCQLERASGVPGDVPVDPEFGRALREHVALALESLWTTCRRLATVKAHDVGLPADHPGLRRVRAQIGDLLAATKDVQRALAELALDRNAHSMDEAALAMRVARRRAEAMSGLDGLT